MPGVGAGSGLAFGSSQYVAAVPAGPDLPSLVDPILHWDASDAANYTVSLGKITAMNDKIAGVYDISQADADNQPVAGGAINSVHAFTHASNINLKTTTDLLGLDAAGDVICSAVFQPSDTVKRYYVTYNDSLFRLAQEGVQDRTGNNNSILSLTKGTAPTLVTGRLNDLTTECWQDGVAETPLIFADVAGNTASNMFWGSSTTSSIVGDIGEIVMYRTASDRAAIEAYLASKWGISLP